DLVPRRVPVDVVHLVQVDVVRLEPPQAGLACAADVHRRELRMVRPLRGLAEHLRRQHDLVAPAVPLGEPPSEDLLGEPLPRIASIMAVWKEEPSGWCGTPWSRPRSTPPSRTRCCGGHRTAPSPRPFACTARRTWWRSGRRTGWLPTTGRQWPRRGIEGSPRFS